MVRRGDGIGKTYLYVDASFAVHNDMKSHTGEQEFVCKETISVNEVKPNN
jgi:hypothetical protein